jgi:uncharacterized protein (TIGR03000 family)
MEVHMVRQGRAAWAAILVSAVLGLGPRAVCAAEGHDGGPGHTLAGFHGYRYAWGPGFRGYYRYPGWYGVGLGLGFGYGCYYGYPYYPCYPYGYGYPVYVDVVGAVPPSAGPPPGPVAAPPGVSVPPGGPAAAAPVRLSDTDVLLSIRVPADATVRINGLPTAQEGTRREFLSSGLAPGRTYTFVVTARFAGPNGQPVEVERRLAVQGGERRAIDFVVPSPPAQNEPLLTANPGR